MPGAGDNVGWLAYNTAAVVVDRRSVPQQRRPVYGPIDPGVAADPTLLGMDPVPFTPAFQVDRRLVPQQRPYLQDPSIYGQAALNLLNGGGTITDSDPQIANLAGGGALIGAVQVVLP